MNTIVVIPARGGSKGIPRKNLRPLAGMPMIYYAINASLKAKLVDRVVVTTDDDEIALFAERFGAISIRRPVSLANDVATLDPVIAHATKAAESELKESFNLVVTVQPTSPLVNSSDIDCVLSLFNDPTVDTALTVVEDRHLCWGFNGEVVVPKYSNRVNRQQLPENFKETGAVIACRRDQLSTGTRIGKKVALHVVPNERSFDIDSFSDLYLCESILNRKRVVFTVIGRQDFGMGHAYRVAILAHELVHHEIIIVCEDCDLLAYEYLTGLNYKVHMVVRGKMLDEIIELQPDLVINDILDTSLEYIQKIKSAGICVVNFEDMGLGSEKADLVVNALYPHQILSDNHLIGPRYFCLRDEFLHLPAMQEKNRVERVLLTFGGTDENNYSVKTFLAILPICKQEKIQIDIVVGPGFRHVEDLTAAIQSADYDGIEYTSSTTRISDHMINADIAITSAGRTIFELSAIGIPTIVLCQNEREVKHSFASFDNGIINLGYCHDFCGQLVGDTFKKVLFNKDLRLKMVSKMKKIDLRGGKARVIGEIKALLSMSQK